MPRPADSRSSKRPAGEDNSMRLRSRRKTSDEPVGKTQPTSPTTIEEVVKEGGNVLALLAPKLEHSYESKSPKRAKLSVADSQAGPAEPASTSATLPSLNAEDLDAIIPPAVNTAYAEGQFPISPTNSPTPVPAKLDVTTISVRQQGLVGLNLLPDDGLPAAIPLASSPNHQLVAQQERISKLEQQISMLNESIKRFSESISQTFKTVTYLSSSVQLLANRVNQLEQLAVTTAQASPITQGTGPVSSVVVLPDDAELLAAPMIHLDPNKGTGKS